MYLYNVFPRIILRKSLQHGEQSSSTVTLLTVARNTQDRESPAASGAETFLLKAVRKFTLLLLILLTIYCFIFKKGLSEPIALDLHNSSLKRRAMLAGAPGSGIMRMRTHRTASAALGFLLLTACAHAQYQSQARDSPTVFQHDRCCAGLLEHTSFHSSFCSKRGRVSAKCPWFTKGWGLKGYTCVAAGLGSRP